MNIKVRFICCSEYDFMDNGKRVQGFSCKCYDENSGKIIKVKTDKMVKAEFGTEIPVIAEPNGNYINYRISA